MLFFSSSAYPSYKGKDEQKEIRFIFPLQDFKQKKLELVLPTGNTMRDKWSDRKQKPIALEYCWLFYLYLFAGVTKMCFFVYTTG